MRTRYSRPTTGYSHLEGRGYPTEVGEPRPYRGRVGRDAPTTITRPDQEERRKKDCSSVENHGQEIKHPLGYGCLELPWRAAVRYGVS